jgi:HK97 family phage portal protein
MGPLERIGTWLQPLARAAGLVETKGNQIVEPVNQQIADSDALYGLIYGAGQFSDVHPILAYRLYLKSDVLGTAVHRIAQNVAGLTLGLTSDDQDFDADASVVDFLYRSSEGYSKRRFFYEIATSYLLTNEAWVVLRGRENREPVARTWVYPFDVVDQRSERDGLPTAFRTVGDRDRHTYYRREQRGQLRWIDETGMNELVPILGAEAVDRPYRGQSQLSPLYYAVAQNVEGKRHNTSVLRNGLKLTGGVQPTEGDRFEAAAVEQIRAALQALRGAGTAGGTLVMPRRVDVIDLALSNREMDYVELLREASDTVYTYYGIPLPLISNEASTFNNYATAQTAFFDGAVFPVFDDIVDALSAGLAARYPELVDRSITYNENTIKALKGRNLERMAKARATQALSTNEIREMAGYDPVEIGDDILVPSTLVSIDPASGMSFPETTAPPEPDDMDDGEVSEDGEPETAAATQ